MRLYISSGLVFGIIFWGAHFLMTFAERGGELLVEGLLLRLIVPPAAVFFMVFSLPTPISSINRVLSGWAIVSLGTFVVGFSVFVALCEQRSGGSIVGNAFCGLVTLGSMLVASGMILSFLLAIAAVPLAAALRRMRS
jgi:hypothetical protein